MADAYGSWAGPKKKWRCHIHYGIESETETSAVVYCQTRFNTNAWGFDVYGTDKATVNGQTASQQTVTHYSASGQTVDTTMITKRVTITKNGSSQSIPVSGSIQITGGYENGTSSASGTVTVKARTYHAHGNPSVTLATSCTQGQQVTVSWAKSGTQGNASFTRFELWQGSNKLYSGTGTSYKVTPSSVTGAKGGSVSYTVKEIHTWYSSEKTTSASKSIAVHGMHGNPTISASKTTANYGESVNLSWAKSATQGNAQFVRFELWQGSNKLYSGSAVSKSVKPSDATGARGGTATYTLKEIHEWYGAYPTTQTTCSITVRSGVVSVYDASGNKHTGLVTAYDSSGNSHYVLISAYDSSGNKHSVV